MGDQEDVANEISEAKGLTKQQLKNKKKREAAKKKKLAQKDYNTNEPNKEVESKELEKDKLVEHEENVEDNYEEELCWCIRQLELGLKNQKPTKEQAAKTSKIITQLKSSKTSKPKKRMLMKQTFGNYREKMSKESQQNVKPAKIIEVKDSDVKKGIFFKKKVNTLPSGLQSGSANEEETFRFSFPDPS